MHFISVFLSSLLADTAYGLFRRSRRDRIDKGAAAVSSVKKTGLDKKLFRFLEESSHELYIANAFLELGKKDPIYSKLLLSFLNFLPKNKQEELKRLNKEDPRSVYFALMMLFETRITQNIDSSKKEDSAQQAVSSDKRYRLFETEEEVNAMFDNRLLPLLDLLKDRFSLIDNFFKKGLQWQPATEEELRELKEKQERSWERRKRFQEEIKKLRKGRRS